MRPRIIKAVVSAAILSTPKSTIHLIRYPPRWRTRVDASVMSSESLFCGILSERRVLGDIRWIVDLFQERPNDSGNFSRVDGIEMTSEEMIPSDETLESVLRKQGRSVQTQL
jgi:hypothetical protein